MVGFLEHMGNISERDEELKISESMFISHCLSWVEVSYELLLLSCLRPPSSDEDLVEEKMLNCI